MRLIRAIHWLRALALTSVLAVSALALVACGGEEDPTANFPERDIEWFVGFDAGGGFDVASRIIAEAMSEDLGVNVVVRNIPGGGGRRAVQEIARGVPDGYSISIVNMPNQITAELLDPEGIDFNSLGWIGRAVIQTYGYYTAEKNPWTSVEQVAASTPEPRFCLTGLSGHSFLVAAISTQELSIPWHPVTGYGAAEIRAALLRGDCELGVGPIAGDTLTAVNGPDFKVLWMFSDERFGPVPDAPTITELGYPDVGGASLANNGLVMAPPGTPDAILDKLSAALNKALADPDVAAGIAKAGMEVSTQTRAQSAASVKAMFGVVEENIGIVQERSKSQ
ncbi:MAG: tripartite tricarboxylate transporter substrate binding protein [Chloroflexota bacterium]